MFTIEILMQAVMESRDGIIIADACAPDHPVIFTNPAFEQLTGYGPEDILGRNCRFLQGADQAQRNINVVANSLEKGEHSVVTLRNYRKDGSLFWNELSISPVFDQSSVLTHFIGIQKDVTARVVLEQRLRKERSLLERDKENLEQLVVHDTLTGIYSRKYFEDQLRTRWAQLIDTQESLVVMFIDVDYFKRFNDTYGHIAGDNALRKIALILDDSLRRVSEFVARFGGEEFIVLATEMTEEQATAHADALCQNVRNLDIPHASSPHQFLTISCGVVHIKPSSLDQPELLLKQADSALYQAKERGRNQVARYEP
jgi:diguanylate cyclase (GGDEF)-like protein/PAS domain S-box-containing protein